MPLKAPAYTPAYSWTGFYIGANAGGARDTRVDLQTTFGNVPAFFRHDIIGGSGWVAGGTVGANYQLGHYVVGVEGDWDAAHLSANSGSLLSGGAGCTTPLVDCRSNISSLGTLRGRLGLAFDRLLFYGTGGGAWGRVETDVIDTFGIGGLPAGTVLPMISNQTGWAAGGGVEWAAWGPMTVKAEFLHVDLGPVTTAQPGLNTTGRIKQEETANILRLGVNYKFDGLRF
jgi:outer membrane immunogenic protein